MLITIAFWYTLLFMLSPSFLSISAFKSAGKIFLEAIVLAHYFRVLWSKGWVNTKKSLRVPLFVFL